MDGVRLVAGTQASLEYGGTAFRDMLRWSSQTFQDHWYYVIAGVVLVLMIWNYLRK